jgi:hypothetical protein
MNVKLWAGVAAIMVILTGTGMYMSSNTPNDGTMVVTAAVNTDGSGIFGAPDIKIEPEGDGWTQTNLGGKTLATPGPTSIQHMMLQDLVENELGLKFVIASTGGTKNPDTVYWVQLGVGSMSESYKNGDIDGGILWEPNFSDTIGTTRKNGTDAAVSIVTSHQLSPGHTCCVIAFNRDYAQAHGDDVIRFLTAYVEIVTWMQNAMNNKSSPEYAALVGYAEAFTKKSEAVVEASFDEVVYKYELTTTKSDIIDMTNTYASTGLVNNTVQDLGFANESAFADWLVNDTYLNTAKTRSASYYTNAPQMTITMAHLVEDIHQLALYVGSDDALGTFSKYHITINKLTPFSAGGPVADALIRGDADVGFLGAPPVVQKTINMGR